MADDMGYAVLPKYKMKYLEGVRDTLIGGRVEEVITCNYYRGDFCLRIKVGKKTFDAWVLSDEEGNDVGHLDIQEVEG
tara:strand:+ start:4008 stop:4241 length:234 start_codon:yes stop_codon:yes gene_type:complete